MPDTPVSTATVIRDSIDGVLLLTAPPGGGRFSETAMARISALDLGAPIVVDGAIEPRHVESLRRASVELVVIGRSLFEAEDLVARAGHFRTLFEAS